MTLAETLERIVEEHRVKPIASLRDRKRAIRLRVNEYLDGLISRDELRMVVGQMGGTVKA